MARKGSADAKPAVEKKAPAAKKAVAAKSQGPDLRADLRAFAAARPEGWGHEDWLSFLDHLKTRGHETGDDAQIGALLERERLGVLLERIPGMGPRRVQAVVERFETAYSTARSDVDELAAVPGMNRALAEKVRQALG
jgi:hypothetical protein